MPSWPPADREVVYVPPPVAAPTPTPWEVRARVASVRVREGLPVSDEILSRILSEQAGSAPARVGMFTLAEREDIYGDSERVAQAQAALAGAEDVLGGIQVCWHNGRRAVRVLLTAEHDRYRRLLSGVLGDRLVIDSAALTEAELRQRQQQVRAQAEELAAEQIFLTRHGTALNGFEIEYLAPDFARADRLLHERFGGFATIRYRGASNHTFRPFPFGSWLSEDDRLHVFYGLPRNGERPGGCEAYEDDSAVVVALTIVDWRGAKTLVGGFIPSHATVQLQAPLGDRTVIDDADNRSRPHWAQA